MARRLMSAAVTATAGFALVVAVPGSASAASVSVSNSYGTAHFEANGEVLKITDYAADGYSVHANLERYYKPNISFPVGWYNLRSGCYDTTGKGDPETTCNYSFDEGYKVRIYLWAEKNGRRVGTKYSASIRS
ncbi:hypothetical protein [Streptomyces sp. NPDC059176]|uniref:hypothetical protein n=1 Tax=unclassified Streptomyces TaxID=2593676 RepID=UPI00369685E6